MKFNVKSLRVEKYIGESVDGHNCDFAYQPGEKTRYILNCETGSHYWLQKWELVLHETEGECGSGWCCASWGHGELHKVKNFIGMTHRPIKELSFEYNIGSDDDNIAIEEFDCAIFYVNESGGDYYYPSGSAYVNMDLFKEDVRNKEKRPVWIFTGDSALGKTYLSSIIRNSNSSKTVYETDSSEALPKELTEDIVVIGNKYNITVDEVKEKLFGDNEVILVNFSKLA